MASSGRSGLPRYLPIAVYVICAIAYGGLMSLQRVIAAKPVDIGIVIQALIYPIWLAVFIRWAVSKARMPIDLPEPTATDLANELKAAGIRVQRLSYFPEGRTSEFPRPYAMGKQVSISKRVLDNYSPQALRWSIKTDSAAASMFLYRAVPSLILCFLLGIVGVSLIQRWKLPDTYLWIPISSIFIAFISIGMFGFMFQFKSDDRFTKTDDDRVAAKETLSYVYFAQKDRSRSDRWLFPLFELTTRAKHLGITLERGYKVENESPV
jgi:hypothetical protein